MPDVTVREVQHDGRLVVLDDSRRLKVWVEDTLTTRTWQRHDCVRIEGKGQLRVYHYGSGATIAASWYSSDDPL